MIRVLLADDELLSRQRLERLVGALPGVEIRAVCASAADALAALREEPIDLALLDIDMPEFTGLEVAALLGASGPQVVFVTAHPEHALAAFGVGATDYLTKPVEPGRLAVAIERVRRARPAPSADPIAIPGARGLRLLLPAEITAAVIDGETVAVHTADQVLFTTQTLSDLEARLPADRFVRVHRRALVRLDAVASLEPGEDGTTARMRDGTTLPVSRAAMRELRRRLGV